MDHMSEVLGSIHPAQVVDRSTRLQIGQGGFLETRTWVMETRTRGLVAKPVKTCKSGGTSCQSSHSPTHLNRYSRT